MGISLLQIDAFTNRPFSGNPAAVCILSEPREAEWMQQVAAEMNLSETAFLHQQKESYSLRWFTPALEVDLCGHATLAAAHALWQLGAPDEKLHFQTRSGLLTSTREKNWIVLDFPAEPQTPVDPPSELVQALNVPFKHVGQNRFDYLVEVDTEETVRALKPNLSLLATLEARGVMVTAPSSDPVLDFVSRYFAPAYGIDEDPVTGSAHCCLAPFWAARLQKTRLNARQCSAREGILRLRLGDERVFIGGQAVTVFQGELQA